MDNNTILRNALLTSVSLVAFVACNAPDRKVADTNKTTSQPVETEIEKARFDYSNMVRISPDVPKDRAQEITATLNFFADTPEGQRIFNQIEENNGMRGPVVITSTDSKGDSAQNRNEEKHSGYDYTDHVLNLDYNSIAHIAYKTQDWFAPMSVDRVLFHELCHAGDPAVVAFGSWQDDNLSNARNVQKIVGAMQEQDNLSRDEQAVMGVFIAKLQWVEREMQSRHLAIEATAMNAANDFMEMYFNEPRRSDYRAQWVDPNDNKLGLPVLHYPLIYDKPRATQEEVDTAQGKESHVQKLQKESEPNNIGR